MIHHQRQTHVAALLLSASSVLGGCITPNRLEHSPVSDQSLQLPDVVFSSREAGSSSLGCSREMVASPVVRRVRELSRGEDIFVKEAEDALMNLSPGEVKELLPLLNAVEESVRETVIKLLAQNPGEEVELELEKSFWREHSTGMKKTVLESIAQLGTESAETFLLHLAERPELGEIRFEAMLLLGERGSPKVQNMLLEQVGQSSIIHDRLFGALLSYRDEQTFDVLKSLFMTGDLSEFRVMLYELRAKQRSDFLPVIQCAPSMELDDFTEGLLFLTRAHLGDKEVLRMARLGCLLEEDPEVGFGQEIALDILGELGETADIPVIAGYFGGKYGYKAAFLMAERFGKEAIPTLRRCLTDDNEMVRVHAMHTLGAIGDTEVSEHLIRWLSLTQSDSEFRHHAVALRTSIDKAGVEKLASQILDGKTFSPHRQSILMQELKGVLLPSLAGRVTRVARYSPEEKQLGELLRKGYSEGALRVLEVAASKFTKEGACFDMLETFGESAAPVYSRMLYAEKESFRREAARRLCDFSDSYSRPDIELLITDPDPKLRAYAAIAGARRGIFDGIEILRALIDSSSAWSFTEGQLPPLAARRLAVVEGRVGEQLREQCFINNNLRRDLLEGYRERPSRAHLEELDGFLQRHRPVFDELERRKLIDVVLQCQRTIFDWHTLATDILMSAVRDNKLDEFLYPLKIAVSEPAGRQAALAALEREPREVWSAGYQELFKVFSSASLEQNIEYPFRFSPETLQVNALNLKAQVRDPAKPLALLVFPRADHNGAFNNYDEMISSLREAGYWVEIYEADSGKGYLETTIRAAAVGTPRAQQVSLICWFGHGADDGRSITVGHKRFGSTDEFLDFTDLSRANFPQFETVLTPGCQGILISCSSGFGRTEKENMANGLRALAPEKFSKEGIWSTVAPSFGVESIVFEKDPLLLVPRIKQVRYVRIPEREVYQAYLWNEREVEQKNTPT